MKRVENECPVRNTRAGHSPMSAFVLVHVYDHEGAEIRGLFQTEADARAHAIALPFFPDDINDWFVIEEWEGTNCINVWDEDIESGHRG